MIITQVTCGQLVAGDHIVPVDDPTLVTDQAINAAYDADEQDWLTVVQLAGHADTGRMLLTDKSGMSAWHQVNSWDDYVWLLSVHVT